MLSVSATRPVSKILAGIGMAFKTLDIRLLNASMELLIKKVDVGMGLA